MGPDRRGIKQIGQRKACRLNDRSMRKLQSTNQNEEQPCKRKAKCYHFLTMPALVIKSFPEDLHAKLRQIAARHRRSVTQETIHLLEKAITTKEKVTASGSDSGTSYWANRKLLPEYEALLKGGAFSGGTDSTQIISEERDVL